MNYKLVVLDMDGTLLDDNYEVSIENKEAINRLIKKGIKFILASGRPYEAIYPYVKDLGIQLPVIAANGSVIKCPLTEEIYYSSVVPLDLTEEIIDYGKENNYAISLYFPNEVLTLNEKMVKVHWELEKVRARLVDEFKAEEPINKMIYSDDPKRIEEAFRYLGDKYKDKLYITCSDDVYLDVMNLDASKGRALGHIVDKLNMSSDEVMVIGNNFNDLPMFEVAGLAVAMANSPEKVKKAADFVTKSNIENGVAYALEKYIG